MSFLAKQIGQVRGLASKLPVIAAKQVGSVASGIAKPQQPQQQLIDDTIADDLAPPSLDINQGIGQGAGAVGQAAGIVNQKPDLYNLIQQHYAQPTNMPGGLWGDAMAKMLKNLTSMRGGTPRPF